MEFPVQLEDGTEVLVEKTFEGDDIVLKDAEGNRYEPAQFGAHVTKLEADESPTSEVQTDTEPVEEEAEETISDPTQEEVEAGKVEETEATEAKEENAEGGVTEEPIG